MSNPTNTLAEGTAIPEHVRDAALTAAGTQLKSAFSVTHTSVSALNADAAAAAADATTAVIVVGRRERLLATAAAIVAALPSGSDVAEAQWTRLVTTLKPSKAAASSYLWTNHADTPLRVVAIALPDVVSRHNCNARPDAIHAQLTASVGDATDVRVLHVLNDDADLSAAAAATSRSFPLYHTKTSKKGDQPVKTARVAFLGADGQSLEASATDKATAIGVRLAARLVDTPCSEMNTDHMVAEARRVAQATNTGIEVIRGHELRERGFGGLWGVGKAASVPPSLVILTYKPESPPADSKTVCWIGKGIVYDTGGLSLKIGGNMCGMKSDMGGAGAILAAFEALSTVGSNDTVHALLCLADNAIGPDATRPDDVLYMYSGRTVEINNTDAEGRLVLADGMAYATRHLKPDVVVDMATLTGAQLVSTGKRHAAIVCNDDDLEDSAVKSGRRVGDLTHPLPYCPEFFTSEFTSVIADLKNSVKDRMNASCACAGQFIAEHMDSEWTGKWLHVDIAGPSQIGQRGSGFGVALLVDMFAKKK